MVDWKQLAQTVHSSLSSNFPIVYPIHRTPGDEEVECREYQAFARVPTCREVRKFLWKMRGKTSDHDAVVWGLYDGDRFLVGVGTLKGKS